MAIFRKIHANFWSDSFISSLDIYQRYFYLYLLTNEQTTQCGIYEITIKKISFDTGYSIDRVSILLKFFEKSGKIRYNLKTNEIAIKNWVKYNASTSPKVQSCVNKELNKIKDRVLIEYLYSIDTHPQQEQEQEQEQKEDKEKEQKKPPAPNPNFIRFQKWILENAPSVASMKEPFTEGQFVKITAQYKSDEITDLLKSMHNWAKLSNNKSAYLTFEKWMKKEKMNKPIVTGQPKVFTADE